MLKSLSSFVLFVLSQGGEDIPVASSSKTPEPQAVTTTTTTTVEIFGGKTFRVMGEARCLAVKQAVEEAGGRLVSEDEDAEVDFVLVRLVRSVSKLCRCTFLG